MPPPPPDFKKRIKAKVGKRARKPENVTDATFRAASLKLATQNAVQQATATAIATTTHPSKNDTNSSNSLISSRGKHLQELATQIQHPAGAVRVAAMKGLLDILMQQQQQQQQPNASSIHQHFSVCITVASKSIVDREPDVRSTGLAVWRQLVQKTTSAATTSTSTVAAATATATTTAQALWQPFAPLLTAYVSTALNSLDQKTRLHGASLVFLFASKLPSVMAPAASKLLPAFARLLPEEQAGTAAGKSPSKRQRAKKKRKTTATTTTTEADATPTTALNIAETNSPVLQALVALLQTTTTTRTTGVTSFVDHNNNNNNGGTIMRIAKYSRGKQALILTSGRRAGRNPPPPFDSTKFSSLDLAMALSGNNRALARDALHTHHPIDHETPIMVSQELLSKLCDKFVELVQPTQQQQQRQPQATRSGGGSSPADWSRLLLVTRAIRLLWDQHNGIDSIVSTANESLSSSLTTKQDSFSKQCHQLTSLLLEHFPFLDTNNNNNGNNSTAIDKEINSEICQILLLMSRTLPEKNTISIKPVIQYVQSEFQEAVSKTSHRCRRNDKLSMPLLDVLGELLLNRQETFGVDQIKGDGEDEGNDNNKTATTLTSLFCAYFFPDLVEAALARSQVGRSAARLVVALIEQHGCSLQAIRQAVGADLVKVLDRILQYAEHWNADYPYDTKAVVQSLLHTVQRLSLNVGKSVDNIFFQHLKTGLEPLFVGLQDEEDLSEPSVLERFPFELQRMIISLITLLGAPTEKMVKALGRICARCHLKVDSEVLSPMDTSFIISSIHSMRKTIKIQTYLSFLIDATGAMAIDYMFSASGDEETKTTTSYRKALALDEAIADSCSYLFDCGPHKVLPMLEPLLSKLLSHEDTKPSFHEAFRIRVALALLAMFSVETKSTEPNSSVLSILSANLSEMVVQGAFTVLQMAESLSEESISMAFLRPINALLTSEEKIASRVENKSSKL